MAGPAVSHTGTPASATVITTSTADSVGLEQGPLWPLLGLGLPLMAPVKHTMHSGSLSLSPGRESGPGFAPLSGRASGRVPLEDCGGTRSSPSVERGGLFGSPDVRILMSEGHWGAGGEGWRESD